MSEIYSIALWTVTCIYIIDVNDSVAQSGQSFVPLKSSYLSVYSLPHFMKLCLRQVTILNVHSGCPAPVFNLKFCFESVVNCSYGNVLKGEIIY